MTLAEGFARLDSVRQESRAAAFALGYAIRGAEREGGKLDRGRARIKLSELRRCAENLGLTYVVRLFAEFEVVLCGYLAAARPGARPRVSMERLTDRVTAVRTIPMDVRDAVHAVREYRIALLHDRVPIEPLTFDQCTTRLNRFLSYLPPRW